PFTEQHQPEDQYENDAGAAPLQRSDGTVELQADSTCAHEAHDGGFPYVDVPAVHGSADESGHHLRDDTIARYLRLARPRGRERLNGPRIDFLDRLEQQLADEADGTQGNRQDAGQQPRSDDAHEQQRPDERVYGA